MLLLSFYERMRVCECVCVWVGGYYIYVRFCFSGYNQQVNQFASFELSGTLKHTHTNSSASTFMFM